MTRPGKPDTGRLIYRALRKSYSMETPGKFKPCQPETLVVKRDRVLPGPALDWRIA
jgi:hypothetical protein